MWDDVLVRSLELQETPPHTPDGQVVPANCECVHVFDISDLPKPERRRRRRDRRSPPPGAGSRSAPSGLSAADPADEVREAVAPKSGVRSPPDRRYGPTSMATGKHRPWLHGTRRPEPPEQGHQGCGRHTDRDTPTPCPAHGPTPSPSGQPRRATAPDRIGPGMRRWARAGRIRRTDSD
jgi:hypothetical protein